MFARRSLITLPQVDFLQFSFTLWTGVTRCFHCNVMPLQLFGHLCSLDVVCVWTILPAKDITSVFYRYLKLFFFTGAGLWALKNRFHEMELCSEFHESPHNICDSEGLLWSSSERDLLTEALIFERPTGAVDRDWTVQLSEEPLSPMQSIYCQITCFVFLGFLVHN